MGSSRGVAISGGVRACTIQGREQCAGGGVRRQDVAIEAHEGVKSLLASRLRPLSSEATHPPNYRSLHILRPNTGGNRPAGPFPLTGIGLHRQPTNTSKYKVRQVPRGCELRRGGIWATRPALTWRLVVRRRGGARRPSRPPPTGGPGLAGRAARAQPVGRPSRAHRQRHPPPGGATARAVPMSYESSSSARLPERTRNSPCESATTVGVTVLASAAHKRRCTGPTDVLPRLVAAAVAATGAAGPVAPATAPATVSLGAGPNDTRTCARIGRVELWSQRVFDASLHLDPAAGTLQDIAQRPARRPPPLRAHACFSESLQGTRAGFVDLKGMNQRVDSY